MTDDLRAALLACCGALATIMAWAGLRAWLGGL